MQQIQQLPQQDQAMVNELASNMLRAASDEQKVMLRTRFTQGMDEASLAKMTNTGHDPLMWAFRLQALNKLKQDRSQANQQALSQQGQPGMPANVQRPPQPVMMQQQRSGNPGMPQQPQPQMGQNAGFQQFLVGVEDVIGQQQQAGVMAQEAGQTVVPASMNQGNATPQPGMVGQPTPGQRPRPNNAQAQQQQHLFNLQQQQNNNPQSQAQLRASAQAKAQQLALQGQPGGMGPMPPQQSPAMGTLNTPIKTPQQPGQTDQQQINGGGTNQFGQPIDPRFAQVNQMSGVTGIGPNGQTIFPPEMSDDQKRKILDTVPKDRLTSVLGGWDNSKAGNQKPQGTPQGTSAGRPNPQVAGQFNQAGMPNQFAANGQRIPQMPPGMNPQQAQLLMQQQMARMQPQQNQQVQAQMQAQMQMNQAQGTRLPPVTPQELAQIAKIDNMPIPAQLLNHPYFRVGVPAEARTWGQLKQWLSQNLVPNAPQMLEIAKNAQRTQFRQFMQRQAAIQQQQQQQQQQAGGLPNGQQISQSQAPQMMPPGMAAPVAPMMQGQLNAPGQANIAAMAASVSLLDIAKARAHPNGRMAGMNDDEIRNILVKSALMNQHRQRQMQALGGQVPQGAPTQLQIPQNPMQQMNQQAQANQGLQRTPGPQVPQMQQLNQQQQQKQQQAAKSQSQQTPRSNAEAVGNAPNARTGKAAQPKPSPAQGPKTLKRSNSDDVVEIVNPHSQQQGNKQAVQQPKARPNVSTLTPEQVARLTPEQKVQYHAKMAQQQQAAQQKGTPQQMEDAARCTQIMKEELAKPVKHPELFQTEKEMQEVKMKLTQTLQNFLKVRTILTKWYGIRHNEEGVRKYWRIVGLRCKPYLVHALTL